MKRIFICDKYSILSTLLLVVILGLVSPSVHAQNRRVDPSRLFAWSIEYEPYKILIEEAIEEYKLISHDNIPRVTPKDRIILIVERLNSGSIYQLFYGTIEGEFMIIDNEKVKWILGKTLIETLLDRDRYNHLDVNTSHLYQAPHRHALVNYYLNSITWVRNDIEIGPDRISYKNSRAATGISFQMGDPTINKPYTLAGYSRLGISSKFWKCGLQMPNMFLLNDDMFVQRDSASQRLNAGWGAFGSVTMGRITGEVSFASKFRVNNFDPSSKGKYLGSDSSNVNFIDLSTSIKTYIYLPSKILPLPGIVTVPLGLTFYRVAHFYKQKLEPVAESDDEFKLIKTAEDPTWRGGFTIGIDYTSPLINNLYPRIEGRLQLMPGTSYLASVTYNINDTWAIPITFVANSTKDVKRWEPSSAFFISVRIRADLEE
ncbi:hypothetical protein JW960_03335 [candidate division KSB1 bacterium]|nr:hypothetical protein [candidate division KSB1 bacterium]